VVNKLLFSDAVLMYRHKLLNYAMKLTGRKELAEDLVNDLYIQAFDKNDTTEITTSNKGYIAKSLYNLFINKSRSLTRIEFNNTSYLEELEQEEAESITGSYCPDMEDELNMKRMIQILNYKIDCLPNKQKEMVRLFLKHQSVAEAARSLGGNFETSKHNYLVGIQNLKEMLCEHQN
jgi:RNA polymerase sigma factor (sigma-70 family)